MNDSSDRKLSNEQQQVSILPNFAMTDYAGQENLPFTCLIILVPRCTSASRTIINQEFDPSVITRGCSSYLRQEFGEHEILDDITRLRYKGNLPEGINGSLRNGFIRQYREWKRTDYVPNNVDEASKNVPIDLLPIITNSPWEIIDKSKKPKNVSKPVTNFVPPKGSIPVTKPQNEFNESGHVNKKKIKLIMKIHLINNKFSSWT
jgi:hypothetical protein